MSLITVRLTVAAAAAVAAITAAAPAWAGYAVVTSANTGRGYLRGCAAQYNIGTTGARFINNAGGGGPCVPADFLRDQNAVVTATGTTDTTGLATSAHDESSVVGGSDAAYATAAADLRTATLHLTATAAGFASADSSAELSDTLHFTVAGATATTVTYIPVSFSFAGTLAPGTDINHASAELGWSFFFGNASAYEFGDYGAGFYAPPNYPTFAFPETTPGRVAGWQSFSFASYTPTDTRFTALYALTGASGDVPIDFRLSLNGTNVALDYTQGGKVGIGHVDGVSFTSDSGVFLSGTGAGTGTVPEPASWALLLAGFGTVGAMARRRRPTVAA